MPVDLQSAKPYPAAAAKTGRTADSPVSPVAAAQGISFTHAAHADQKKLSEYAAELGIPFLDLSAYDRKQCPERLIDSSLVLQHQALPLYKRHKRLYIATADPANNAALKDIQFHTGLIIEMVLCCPHQLRRSINEFITFQEASQPLLQDWDNTDSEQVQIKPAVPIDNEDALIDEAPIVRFVNKLLVDAMAYNASDIHIEPYERTYRVRFRLDGILREIARPPIRLAGRIASRVKVMAQLDISEKRSPQDGRLKVHLAGSRSVDVRVNILPTIWGEKVVLRLMNPHATRLGIDALGFEQAQKTLYLRALQQSQGLILVTGPTGSGKSVTLYTGLTILNSSERNIATAEDPVELHIEGVNQVCVNARSGFDFAAALRAFLRQDPDVIMVGEIRDRETAETAIRAAQTGHLVLSTLHTNNAMETINRLMNMGIASYNLTSSISLIIAQKLLRRLCEFCKEKVSYSEKLLKEAGFTQAQLPGLQLYRAAGCAQCKRGFQGRIGIFEVVPVTPALSRSIMTDGLTAAFDQMGQTAGYSTLRDAALVKVARGQVSLDEANRLV